MRYVPTVAKRRLSSNTRLELTGFIDAINKLSRREDVTPDARTDLLRARERIAAALSHMNTKEGAQ